MSATASASSVRGRQRFWRLTTLVHRYLGIVLGILVLAWCVSGIIMMYVQYPALERSEQLAALQPLDLTGCCNFALNANDAALAVHSYSVENLLGQPVLRLTLTSGEHRILSLADGAWLTNWDRQDLDAIGEHYAAARSWQPPDTATVLERDQWTVHSRFNRHRPMLKYANDDGLEWYVSSRAAEIVQVTAAAERWWNWLGSVTHWLYPTVLRQHTAIWAQTVIWLTIVSVFLTITGLLIGIRQFTAKASGWRSPYRGWTLWHHYVGLVFGALTLTWLVSGFFSMNPWGTLESRSFRAEADRLSAVNAPLADVIATLQHLSQLPAGGVRLSSAYWLGEPYFLAWERTEKATRMAVSGSAAALSVADAQHAARLIRDAGAVIARLDSADAYYYSHHDEREFPVFRLSYPDGDRYYLSSRSGELLLGMDANRRWYRWLFEALHRGDFHAIVRLRPLWDGMMLLALLGVSIGVGTGTYLGIKRLTK
ncbi:MAG: PepSY domain-containing protein [Gammaproteobacteria bacterium]|nr:PepSY domain-containing protein [Gammaproteobacteria bacterium]